MDGDRPQTRTSLGDKIGFGVVGIGFGLLLFVPGVLILLDVLNPRGIGAAAGVVWPLVGALFIGVTIAELRKPNAFQTDTASSSGHSRETGIEVDFDCVD